MNQYAVENNNEAVLLTERPYGDAFFRNSTGCEIYNSLSEAVDAFEDHYPSGLFVYSTHGNDYISVIATKNDSSLSLQGYDGPYDDFFLAYGVQHIKGTLENNKMSFFTEPNSHPAARMIYEYYISLEGFEHCRMKTVRDGIGMNIIPLNDPGHIKPGTEMRLRLTGQTDDVSVFESPEIMTAETHLPPYIMIPIGTYHSNLRDQDATVVLTGQVTRAFLISEQSQLRYMMTVRTMDMEIDLDVFTHYTIQDGNYISAKTNISALFPH